MTGARRLRHELPAILVLTALVALQLWPAAGPGRLPESPDLMLQFVPNAAYLASSLREGRLPLWNPYLGAGMPFAADPGTGAWYLPNWAPLLTLPAYAAVRVTVWLHLLWAALGAYSLCRAVLSVSRLAALVGAVAFALTTWLPALAGMPAVLTSVGWIPWVIVLGWLAGQRGGRWIAALAGAAALQAVSGWPAGAYLAWLALGVLWLGTRRPGRRLIRLSTAGLLSLLLAAVLVVPALEFISQSSYAETRSVDSAAREGYLTLLSWLRPAAGSGALESSQLYLGMAALLLAIVGAGEWRRPATRALLVLLVLSLLIATGTRTPLFGALYAWLPGFRIVYLPSRLGILAALAAAGLAAIGAERLQREPITVRFAALASAVFAVLVPLTLLQFWHSEGYDNFRRLLTNLGRLADGPYVRRDDELRYLGYAALALACLLIATRRQWHLAAPLAAAVLVVDVLATHHAALPPAFDPDRWYAPALETAQVLQGQLGHERFAGAQWHGTQHFLTDFPRSADPALLPPNLALLSRVRDAQAYDPLLLRPAAEYFAWANRRARGHATPEDHWLWLDQFSADYVDNLAISRVLAPAEAAWRVRGVPVLHSHQLRAGDPPAQNSLIDVPPFAGPARLHVVTYLGEATGVPDGALVGEVVLTSRSGEERHPLWAGVHTAEWAYDRPDVAGTVAHQQAPVALATQIVDAVGGRYRVYEYLATFDVTLGGQPTSIAVLPRLPLASRTTLNVSGVWLEDSAVLPESGRVSGVLRNDSARPRLSAGGGEVTWIADLPERIEASVESAGGTTVTLADTLYPGWVAYVDGQPAAEHQADGLFRAVNVPAGAHRVTFSYEPLSLRLGLAATVLGAIAVAWLCLPRQSRARRPTNSQAQTD